MLYPPVWLWLIAFVLVLVGLLLSRSLARLPGWLCTLVVVAAFIGIWYLFKTQASGLVFRFFVP